MLGRQVVSTNQRCWRQLMALFVWRGVEWMYDVGIKLLEGSGNIETSGGGNRMAIRYSAEIWNWMRRWGSRYYLVEAFGIVVVWSDLDWDSEYLMQHHRQLFTISFQYHGHWMRATLQQSYLDKAVHSASLLSTFPPGSGECVRE